MTVHKTIEQVKKAEEEAINQVETAKTKAKKDVLVAHEEKQKDVKFAEKDATKQAANVIADAKKNADQEKESLKQQRQSKIDDYYKKVMNNKVKALNLIKDKLLK